jgi:hypothetical protein
MLDNTTSYNNPLQSGKADYLANLDRLVNLALDRLAALDRPAVFWLERPVKQISVAIGRHRDGKP